MARRSVEVSGRHAYGTGCLIAAGLVLTAHHVAKPALNDVVKVRDIVSSGFIEATVVWEDSDLDVVVLKADRDLLGAGMPVVRFGEVVCNDPGRRPVCSMTGFPKAMRRKAAAGTDGYVDDLKTVDGRIAPHTGSRSLLYGFEVDGSLPAEARKWQGLSGAGVFCEGTLVGMVRLVDRDWDRTLLALPISHLLQAEGFAEAVTEHTGMLPRLQPADLRSLLSQAPDPALSSSHLLDPRSQVVDYRGMAGLIGRIERWCRDGEPLDVAPVTGLGGTGKSRLVTELLHRLSTPRDGRESWSGGFLAETPAHTDYGMLASSRYPLLVAIDLAETRIPQIRDVTKAITERHDGGRLRILLLARGHGDWWPPLRRHLRAQQVGPVSETFQVTVGDARGGRSPEDVYVDAKAGFAHRIRLLQQAGHDDDTWSTTVVADAPRHYGAGIESTPEQPVIYHHIAALADVLAHANPDFTLRDHPMEVLLANEENYLRRIAEARLPEGTVDAKLIRTLVTAQFLAGARTAKDGAAAIRAGFDAHHHRYGIAAAPDARHLAALDDVLAAAYPATDGAHWGAMGQPLATALLGEVETDSGNAFVERFLQHDALEHDQRHQALSVIACTAPEQPELGAGAQRAVAADPERLLPLAAKTVTAELDADQAQQWLTGVKDAVAEQARQPDADPDTYRWATDVLNQTPEWPPSDPDDLRTFEELIDALLAEDTDSTDASNDHGAGEDSAPAASPHRVLVRPQVSWPSRAVVTCVAICHLVLIAAVTSSAALSGGLRQAGWAGWLFVPLNLSAHLAIANLYGGRHMDYTAVTTWIGPPFMVGMTTLSALMANEPLPPPWPPWVLWPAVFSAGLYGLTLAWRIWFGQLHEPDAGDADTAP